MVKIQHIIDKDSWLLKQDLTRLQAGIKQAVDALPLPVALLGVDTIQASTFHALALMIIRQGNKRRQP